MAQARRRHLDQDFASAGRVKVELSDFERLRMGIGRLEAGLAKNGGLDAHCSCLLNRERPMLGEIGGRGNRKIDRRRTALAPRMRPRHIARQARVVEPRGRARSRPMPQTQSKFFDDLSRLMTDAAGLADGAKREAQTFARSQMERMMAGMNVVAREEFEAVKEMAAKARDENEKLAARVAALEAKLGEPRP
jgi:BMFP domain-containing protein YqiC